MRRVAVFGAVLVAIVVAWLCWPTQIASPSPTEPAAPTPDGPGPAPAAAAATATPAAEPVVDATSQRTEAPAPVPTPVVLGPEFVLRGRCVDATGNPFAGVEATVHGWICNDERMAAWTKDHDAPKWSDYKATTGVDGAFTFRFWPPPPFQFALDLSKLGCVTMSGRWGELEPGGNKDLGDIVMAPGTLLRGRVLDANSAIGARIDVHFDRSRVERPQRDADEIEPRSGDIGYVRGQDGTFTCRTPLPPGSYSVDVPHRTVKSPKTVVIDGSASEQFVDVVLEALDDSKAIAGIVVDELGAPVRGVMVTPMRQSAGQHWIISTDKEGRFRVPRPEQDAPASVQLTFQRDGFELLQTKESYAWGRNDLRIAMQHGLGVEILVVAAADGRPVEDYQLRVLPFGTSGFRSSQDLGVRGKAHHDGGRTSVQGIRRGPQLVVVEPTDQAFALTTAKCEVADGAVAQLTVRLPVNLQRELRVQRADGAPVAGATVQFADVSMTDAQWLQGPSGDDSLPPSMRLVPLEQWLWNPSGAALLLQTATTDAGGKALLRGPGDRGLLLLLPGPPNVPRRVADVRLDVVEPLVVMVSSGARLEGVVRPTEIAAELRRLAGLPPTGAVGQSDQDCQPSVQLVRGTGTALQRFPAGDRAAYVGADGAFALAGIPPGTWTVQLNWRLKMDNSSTSDRQTVGTVALQDGTTTRFDIDASFLTPGKLDGTVMGNGAPFADAKLTAIGTYGKDEFGNDRTTWLPVATDGEGRFHLHARAGEYRVAQHITKGPRWSMITSAETAFVVAGRTVAQTFRLVSGTVRVRVLDAKGSPVAAIAIELRSASGTTGHWLPPTGTDGWTQDELETLLFTAAVLPRRLQDQQATDEFWRANAGNPDPLATVRITLGEVQAGAGATKEFELRLPAGW